MAANEPVGSDLAAQLALKARLPRSWSAFFARYGRFSPAQLAAAPVLLDGANLVLCAPTASGKTAAVLAPLIERHCPPVRPTPALAILYLVPTRALVNDLRARLADPLESLGLRIGARTGESTFAVDQPPDVLLATPEAADSLLASHAALFAGLRAVVIDELHLFDGTPRGDQLRAVLARIRRVRAYAATRGDAPHAALQYAALSATLAQPAPVAERYFPAPQVASIAGGRAIQAEQLALDGEDSAGLLAYLAGFRARGWRKALAFCNSRAEVEAYAAALRSASPFGSAVYVHYSNIDPRRRREIEQQFAAAEAAICFASSTLELGIDIGSIDVVIMIGPPGSAASFAQRLGRGSRRQPITRVACCARTPLERLLFAALLREARGTSSSAAPLATPAPFRPAVAVQQIFSMLKQSPSGALRLGELAELFAGMLAPSDLEALLVELKRRNYLAVGRPGEWRPGPRLNKLLDEQGRPQAELSVFSNIQSSAGPLVAVRDRQSGQIVASVEARWLGQENLTLEGRPLQIAWADGEAVWVDTAPRQSGAQRSLHRSARQSLSLELAWSLPTELGLAPGSAPLLNTPTGWLWFHWLGDLYGAALLGLLRYRVSAAPSAIPGLALRLPEPPEQVPVWQAPQVVRYLHDSYRQFEPLLDLGPFQALLPTALRRRAVVEQFNVARFLAAVAALQPSVAPETLALDLAELLGGDEASQ